jgi:ABC-2 type transport system permease protein
MGLDASRVRAVVRKELRDFRRKRSIVVTMCILPVLFLIEPVVTIFLVTPSSTGAALQKSLILPILYLLLIPTIMPSTLAAYSVIGEREQGTLEPLLTTPIRRQEFLVGKATSVMIPTVVLSYTVFAVFLGAVQLFANPAVASAVFHNSPVILALFLLAPLLAGWGIVVGMAVSVRASEARVAQQLSMLASLPPVALIILLAVGVVRPTFLVAIVFAVGLLALDALLLRFVTGMFDRERLVTGAKAT